MRNVPVPINQEQNPQELRRQLQLPAEKFIYIIQGSGINIDRGAEEAVDAMQYINALLIIAGSGDVVEILKKEVKDKNLEQKVIFTGRLPYEKLMQYTAASDVGLSLDKDTNINYRFSLPNKIFDYIYAHIAILASALPEVMKVIDTYGVGAIFTSHQPELLAKEMQKMMNDKERLSIYKQNTIIAARELNWNSEKKILTDLFATFD
jgi:glycosyltransferase involved in cell wall biosynthesis